MHVITGSGDTAAVSAAVVQRTGPAAIHNARQYFVAADRRQFDHSGMNCVPFPCILLDGAIWRPDK